jgi:urea carboxylase
MFEIIDPGFGLTIQDYPGRTGYWNIGIPPSGPMDSLSFRIANAVIGNLPNAAGLEITAVGPELLFHDKAVISIAGAKFEAVMNGKEIPWQEPVSVPEGGIVKIGRVQGNGLRAYMAISGGIDVPEYLGSRSTFVYGGFGGIGGRPLKQSDMLEVIHAETPTSDKRNCKFSLIPDLQNHWEIGIIMGPHGSPDFFTEEFEKTFLSYPYKADYNANRLGIRLIGPKPSFTRKDGGEGGRHPSNMHDYAYAIGTVNFSGDVPIIIGVDGPSLGGFISFVTIPTPELWKTGQIKPGDTVKFFKMTMEEAIQAQRKIETAFSLMA